MLTTLAGTGAAGFTGDDGPATSAALNRRAGVAVHPNGDIYFFDFENRRVRRIRSGRITTVAGTPNGTTAQGPELQVNFQTFTGMTLDGEGANLHITDERSHRFRRIGLDGIIKTLVGMPRFALEDP